jgi:hypothetical protein
VPRLILCFDLWSKLLDHSKSLFLKVCGHHNRRTAGLANAQLPPCLIAPHLIKPFQASGKTSFVNVIGSGQVCPVLANLPYTLVILETVERRCRPNCRIQRPKNKER